MIITKSTTPDALRETMSTTQSMFRVAAIQMASGPNVTANLQEAGRLIELAAATGSRIVALPEYFAILGMKDTDKVAAREKDGSGPIQQFLSEQSKRHRIWIVGGSVPMEASVPDKVRNSCLIYNQECAWAATTRSISSASTWDRSATAKSAPSRPATACARSIHLTGSSASPSATTCAFRSSIARWAMWDLILVPSAFTETTGKAHWDTLIRARAIENLAYVIAPAQGGYHVNGRETHGHTMIVDPWGVVLDRLPRGSGVVVAGVNPTYQAKIRKSLPALTHKTVRQW